MSEFFKVIYTRDPLPKKRKRFLDGWMSANPAAKTLELFDDEGRSIARSKPNAHITEDVDAGTEYAYIGSFYVQIDFPIHPDDFSSGRCFTEPGRVRALVAGVPAAPAPPPPDVSKKPSRNGGNLHEIVSAVASKQTPKEEFFLNELGGPGPRKATQRCVVEEGLLAKLKPHQKEGVRFLFNCLTGLNDPECEGCVLADAMGLGKTLQVIALVGVLTRQSPFGPEKQPGGQLRPLKRPPHLSASPSRKPNLLDRVEGLVRKVLIVTPLTLLHNWAREFEKWVPDSGCSPILLDNQNEARDTADRARQFVKNANKVMLCTYETLTVVAHLLRESVDLLVCDEAHRLKNTATKMFGLLSSFRTRRRVFITGTPLQNRLEELFATLNFVAPLRFDSEAKFRSVFTVPIAKGLMRTAEASAKTMADQRARQLTESIRPLVLRRGEEVMAPFLPPKTELFVFLPLTPVQAALYEEVLGDADRRCFNVKTNRLSDVLALLSDFRKLLAHPAVFHAKQTGLLSLKVADLATPGPNQPSDLSFVDRVCVEDSLKLSFALHLLGRVARLNAARSASEPFHKTILVSYSTKILTLVELLVRRRGFEYFRLDGHTKLREREATIEKFANPQNRVAVFLLCAKAGGTGLNLVTANRMVLLDVDWNPANDKQVMGRVFREGQRREVFIYRLFAEGTIEEEILNRQFEKECLAAILLGQKESVATFGGYEEKENFTQFLFRFLRRKKGARDAKAAVRLPLLRSLANKGEGAGDLDEETSAWVAKVCVKDDVKELFRETPSGDLDEMRRRLFEELAEDEEPGHPGDEGTPRAGTDEEAQESVFWEEKVLSGCLETLGEKKQAPPSPAKRSGESDGEEESKRILAGLGFD